MTAIAFFFLITYAVIITVAFLASVFRQAGIGYIEYNDSFIDGFNCQREGFPLEYCPHKIGTEQYYAWFNGWKFSEKDRKKEYFTYSKGNWSQMTGRMHRLTAEGQLLRFYVPSEEYCGICTLHRSVHSPIEGSCPVRGTESEVVPGQFLETKFEPGKTLEGELQRNLEKLVEEKADAAMEWTPEKEAYFKKLVEGTADPYLGVKPATACPNCGHLFSGPDLICHRCQNK